MARLDGRWAGPTVVGGVTPGVKPVGAPGWLSSGLVGGRGYDVGLRVVGLVSLTDAINTTSAQGRLVFNRFASLAEFERELIRKRTHAGLASARSRSRVGSRSRGLSDEAERTAIIAETLYREQQLGVNEIAQRLRISKVTLYKYLRHRNVAIHAHPKPAAGKAAD